jgi:hypothetical protein
MASPDSTKQAKRAIDPAALKTVVTNERLLQRMRLPVPRQSLDCRHVPAVALRRQRQTREHPLTVHQNRACAARSLIAALLRPDQAEVFAQRVEQRHPAIQPQTPRASVDA